MLLADLNLDLPPEALRGIEGPFEDGSYAYGGFRLELEACDGTIGPWRCGRQVWLAWHNEATIAQLTAIWERAGGDVNSNRYHFVRHVAGSPNPFEQYRYIQDVIDKFNAQVAKEFAENMKEVR